MAVLKHTSEIVAYNSDDGGGKDDCGGGGFNSGKGFFESWLHDSGRNEGHYI